MDTTIRKYKSSDRKELKKCLEGLCDYLIPLDPLKKIRRLPEWATLYSRSLLEKIKRNDGVIYVAQYNNKIIGIVAGIILKQSKLDQLDFSVTKSGRVLELFIEEKYRNKQIGKKLMDKIEQYFRNAHCDIIRIEVFEPNIGAHRFYKKLGYMDRVIDLIKEVK